MVEGDPNDQRKRMLEKALLMLWAKELNMLLRESPMPPTKPEMLRQKTVKYPAWVISMPWGNCMITTTNSTISSSRSSRGLNLPFSFMVK